MRERLIRVIPGAVLAALSWILFWTFLIADLE